MKSENNLYGISVAFKQFDGWSKNYGYLSNRDFKVGEAIVVPTGDFYSVGKVVSTKKTKRTEISPGIPLKHVVGSISELKGLNK